MEREKLIWDYGDLDGDNIPIVDDEEDDEDYPWWD